MTTPTATDEQCPERGGAEGTYWCYGTAESDLWSCRCGCDWTVRVEVPQQRTTQGHHPVRPPARGEQRLREDRLTFTVIGTRAVRAERQRPPCKRQVLG